MHEQSDAQVMRSGSSSGGRWWLVVKVRESQGCCLAFSSVETRAWKLNPIPCFMSATWLPSRSRSGSMEWRRSWLTSPSWQDRLVISSPSTLSLAMFLMQVCNSEV